MAEATREQPRMGRPTLELKFDALIRFRAFYALKARVQRLADHKAHKREFAGMCRYMMDTFAEEEEKRIGLPPISAEEVAAFEVKDRSEAAADKLAASMVAGKDARKSSPKSKRAHLQRDVREVAYYADSTIEAGTTTGTFAGNAPGTIPVPSSWNLPVDFVAKVHGDSMSGFIEDGELGAFIHSHKATNGQVVAALVDGQVMIKLFNDPGDGAPELMSINSRYKPIPCVEGVQIQGIYQGKFPPPKITSKLKKK